MCSGGGGGAFVRGCLRSLPVTSSRFSFCRAQSGEAGRLPAPPRSASSSLQAAFPGSWPAPCVLPATSWLAFPRRSSERVPHAAGRVRPGSCQRARASPPCPSLCTLPRVSPVVFAAASWGLSLEKSTLSAAFALAERSAPFPAGPSAAGRVAVCAFT